MYQAGFAHANTNLFATSHSYEEILPLEELTFLHSQESGHRYQEMLVLTCIKAAHCHSLN
jgi:hypothetical protein